MVIVRNGPSIANSKEFLSSNLSEKLRAELEDDDALGKDGLTAAEGLASYLDGPSPITNQGSNSLWAPSTA